MVHYQKQAMVSMGVSGRVMAKEYALPLAGFRGDFNLKNFQDGVLSAAFMVGLLVASPIFASSAKSICSCVILRRER
ncbi:probable sphingolipid transporter spinster homolog 2 isoform X2 [Pistacia vera]|uniref:probable sphingolipid transporter spinster homolog 2 isoform X2 n=1 Tax=Pistacia vera TaxID=55513 RepID=UPI00126359A0|nr:probable sphingolipid transporter spinster homolog 2 isoform X2 [Pistacia vera]